jgi:phosphoribosylformylglycinamidine synthase subunit PurL
LIDDWSKMARIRFAADDHAILLVGAPPAWGTHLAQSVYMRDIHGRTDGPAPSVDLAHEKRTGLFVRDLIRSGIATAVHDCSDGGLGVALAEMAMASGIGATVNKVLDHSPVATFFGEDQGRYVVTVKRDSVEEVQANAERMGIFAPWIGTTGGNELKLGNSRAISVAELKSAHESWFPDYMNS